nr:PREDICTED: uncharacterized protein LOC108199121 isoform X2 [Daucus carota subsp. sativus]
MQNKLHAIRDTKKLNPLTSNDNIVQKPFEEEHSDWPHGLLAIGTFGNKNVNAIPETCNLQSSKLSQDNSKDIDHEEFRNHQKKSNIILDRQDPESNVANELESHHILEKTFKTSSTSDINRPSSYTVSDDIGDEDGPFQLISGTVVINRGKESHLDSTKNASIGKESLSLLLKKMFKSEITPTSSLRDSFPEARLEKSRMNKIFRSVLNKKIFPQSLSTKATSTKKCLNNKQHCMSDGKNILAEEISAGSKWVKTDSDFIVLEI